jgi:lytic murein transglycosylase
MTVDFLPRRGSRPDPARRWLAGLLAALPAAALLGLPGPALAQATAPGDFRGFIESLWPAAKQAGVSRATFDGAVSGLTPDPALQSIGGKQAEFERPLKAYVAGAAAPARAARARQVAAQWSQVLDEVERRYGVPREVVLAIWGMETDFGRDHGERDVIRSIASLAYYQPQRTKLRDEFVAALVILQSGQWRRDRLRGSWAGAMGNPQFMPSAYLQHAVSFDGSGAPDIWDSVPDTLASIANFLKHEGWDAGSPWGAEVVVPRGFRFDTIRQDTKAWSAAQFRTVDGAPLPGRGAAMLFLPVGTGGPAFLLQPNFFVLKEYNFSDAYALAVSILSDRIAGKTALRGPWPDEAQPLSRTQRRQMQEELARRGLYQGDLDGRVGPLMRDAVHAYQKQAGLEPADGYPGLKVYNHLTSTR